jgi:succinate dehydrogenase/fumarate reductase flavoprotein subunit
MSKTKTGRRAFLKETAAGLGGAAALAGLGAQEAVASQAAAPINWDLDYEVVVIGSGAAGMPAAIAARDHGASVIVVEKNWDVGGRAILSGGNVQLGCGNRLQQEAGVHDSPDQFFRDWTGSEGHAPVDPALFGTEGHPLAKHADREIVRAFADNAVATFEFLETNGVEWARLGGIRGPGDPKVPRQTVVKGWANPAELIIPNGPGYGTGSGLIRPLEKAARAKGIRILLLHRMTQIHREGALSGRVLGITAAEVDRWNNPTGRTVNIRARKGVVVAAGGPSANVNFRRIYDPRLTEEYQVLGHAYTTKDADGEIAAMAIGASLWTACNQVNLGDRQIDRAGSSLGTKLTLGGPLMPPDSPAFFRQGTTGLRIVDWQNAILVKETGRRFYEETLRGKPLGSLGRRAHIDAALEWTGDPKKLNGGGPIWAIFDAAAVTRQGWITKPPHVDPAGGFFFVADTLEELARTISGCPYQWRPMPGDALRAAVERYNSFVDSGVDLDFDKPTPTHKINTPPFYAAWATPALHDVMAGLRINTNAQVIDLHGQPIPGLYAAGECASGISQHGLAKSVLFGRLAGLHAANG